MIHLANEQDAIPIDESRFLSEVEALAKGAGFAGDLSLAVVTDKAIHDLNRRYLDHDYPTDVLAFPLDEEEGEVVVSADRALAEAGDRGVDPHAELLLHVVHGILHLSGHDDHDPEDARRMHEASLELLRGIGYRNRIAAPGDEAGG